MCEFQDADDVTSHLLDKRAEIAKWFNHRLETLHEVTRYTLGGDTFRAFHNTPQKPSVVFRDWALATLQKQNAIDELVSIGSQTQYDDWAKGFSKKLTQEWKRQMGSEMLYAHSRKLPDLLLKGFVLWKGINDTQRHALISYLHVPLDQYVLAAIRNCISDPEIPRTATMRFVSGETMYNQIQQEIRKLTDKAQVPAIYFDILVWDMRHQAASIHHPK